MLGGKEVMVRGWLGVRLADVKGRLKREIRLEMKLPGDVGIGFKFGLVLMRRMSRAQARRRVLRGRFVVARF